MLGGSNTIDMLMASRGGYRAESGAVIFPQSKQEKELEDSVRRYEELSDELESKISRVDELLDRLED